MPTLLKWNGFRFYFFSNEGYEPPHLHVDKGDNSAKIWLHPIKLGNNYGFTEKEISVILEKITEKQTEFLGAWNEYFRK